MLKFTTAALAAALLAAAPGCGVITTEEDCPACEEKCWEGPPHCKKCRKQNGCSLADPGRTPEGAGDLDVEVGEEGGGGAAPEPELPPLA
jgi:uncharacterized membrane protein